MRLITFTNITALLFLHCFLSTQICSAIDTITQNQVIKDHESIISKSSVFKLGFFSPNGSSNRYVGIWFNEASVLNVIWVANRDEPLKDSNGIIRISEDGNLLVLNGLNHTIWSSNFSSTNSINSSARILDSGNLILIDDETGGILWESFKNLSDSFLPRMKLSSNKLTREKTLLSSWTSPSDPSIGNFSAGLNPMNVPEFFIWNNNRPYWRSGPWNGQVFIGVPSMTSDYLDGFSIASEGEDNEISYITVSYANESVLSSFVLDSQGVIKELYWEEATTKWEIFWLSYESECDVYAKCGEYGICNAESRPICRCLRGFEPKHVEEWSKGNWTGGCVRTKEFQCERIKNGGEEEQGKENGSEEQGKKDGFLKMKAMKVPDLLKWSSSLEEKCKNECFENCSCVAYAFDSGIGCMSWSGSLLDIQEFSRGGTDLYIRVPYSELDHKRDMKMVISIIVILGTLGIAVCAYFTWRLMARQRGNVFMSIAVDASQDLGRKVIINKEVLYNRGAPYLNCPEKTDQEKLEELPVFAFATLAAATNNFDMGNKLGQGGFGHVYKGKLVCGQEIAVKRLSRDSGQGLEEFMNEVVVISKLQHRNLVRLLGCCVDQEEKMLVYEYMPNNSLDSFIFDPLKHELLDWKKCFEIIVGIGRGLLYLHRDSRLRIIHRDLKASNILLDEELNPKISDFGMARIFVTDQDQANTRRVVGTYGYMSPEYAMEGKFSEKSDVFSFGVLLLEIVIRRRNTAFYNDDQSISLLGFVWKLWNEQKVHELLEQMTPIPSFQLEILRCIHVGLLCVQEFAKDRPNVSVVLSMLTSEILDLPTPKQPAFTTQQIGSISKSTPNNPTQSLGNNSTITIIEGR